MGIVYRQSKQEPLTIEEMDGNFAYLEERLKFLEDKPPVAEGVASLTQEGDQVTFQGTFGTHLGKILLPKAFPACRGKWLSETSYCVLDWVQFQQGIYSCVKAHTSKNFEEDKGCWALVFHPQ